MSKYDVMQAAVEALGLSVQKGWQHTLLHHGTSRKEVYKAMYGQLVYGSGLARPGTTIVYPELVREVIRERFPDPSAGAFDTQYLTGEGKHISLEQMARHQWRGPPKSCQICGVAGAMEKKTKKAEKKHKPY